MIADLIAIKDRVTRLDEFSPIWAIVYYGQFFVGEVWLIFELPFSTVQVTNCRGMGWATFWRLFYKLIWPP
jgi:hypothetical protein